MRTIEIKCRFCEKINGSFDVPDDVQASYEELVEDARCDEHTELFGNYKNMQDEYILAGGTLEEFNRDIKKAEYKIQNFQQFIDTKREDTKPQKEQESIILTGSSVDEDGNVTDATGKYVGNINDKDCPGCR